MLLDQSSISKNVVAAQITKVFYPHIIVRTETGDYWSLEISEGERSDSVFWEEMRRILKAALWIPVGKKYHQLLDNGWMAPTY
ncbi:hypothetical protein LFYK43_08480 [Ligilactobacillus salitolerans]|uniref:Uncharacterized protein n=1 Tax=Ligilactobacillus salitolerans TaxID=1808352 RepID=A0A401IS81_9LACO|nr:hypothetical protein [Ligilactobacillus salitolerans]GBG94389.1 hypothetical protein LFYK43_08480 [Ligilactobacillus salitolerans]